MSEEMPQRPGFVRAAGIMLIVFGSLAVFGLIFTALPYMMSAEVPQKKEKGGNPFAFVDPTPRLMAEEPEIINVMTGLSIFGAILGAAKIWAGIGVLRLRPTARIAGIALAIVTIIVSIAGSVHSSLYFLPGYLRIAARDNNAPEVAEFLWVIEVALWGMTGVSIVVSFAVWLIVILMLNSQRTRNAFMGITDTPIDEPKPETPPRYAGYEDEDSI